MNIFRTQIKTGFKGDFCYTHARGAVMPDGFAVITTQPLRLSGCDVFYGMEMLFSSDSGKSWSPIKKSATLIRKKLSNGMEQTMSDATPFYHRASGKLLLTGHDVIYRDDRIAPPPRPRHTVWTVFDREKMDFEPFRELTMPDEKAFFSCGSGSGQILELPDGDLLIPVYFMSESEARTPNQSTYHVMVMRCSFDGKEVCILEYGNSLTIDVPRGLGEPSIVESANRYFLALRNDKKGYVASSGDGLNFSAPRVLCFDDGQESGNYCTQQHWIKCGGKLYMVYTRRDAGNDHVFRHRAPLFIAEFDRERCVLIRDTETIAIPERGARLGNFGCTQISDDEGLIIASEWMQTTAPDHGNWQRCMSYGSDNSIFVARVTP